MDIKLKLNKNFVACLNKMTQKYGEKFERINGFHNENLNFNDFIDNFIDSKNVADVSIDANANSSTKDINTLKSDMMKPHMKLLAFNKIFYEITKKYGLSVAEEWFESEWNGAYYLHNAATSTYLPYCYAYDLDQVVEKGLYFIDKFKSTPAQHLTTFNDHVLEFISWTANRSSGAVGLPSYLVYSYYYWNNDVQNNFYLKNPEYYREQCFQKFIYDLNQPYLRVTECVTEDTEVLTPQGFKSYNELNVGDNIYTWNDGKLNTQKVQKITIREHDGDIHRYEGRDITQVVTPNHRVLYKKFNTKEYNIKYSSELINAKTPLDIPVAFLDYDKNDYDISDELLELVTIILTDGYILSEENKQSRIGINKSKERYGIDRITELLNNLNLSYSMKDYEEPWEISKEIKYNNSNMVRFTISVDSSRELLKAINYTRDLLPNWFTELSRKQANLVIDTWAKFDGNTNEKNYNRQRCQCDNYDIANQLQHICVLAGRGSRIASKLIGKNKKETIYLIPYSKNRVNKSVNKKTIEHYTGKVWCPTTQDGVVMFRKDGKVFISGNCAFTNISIMDKNYLTELFGARQFPNGEFVIDHIDGIIEHQKVFMEVISKIREKLMMTFPVLTYSLLFQDGKFIDEEFARWCNRHNMKWFDSNFYVGNDVTTLSNCCRLLSNTSKLNGFINSIGGTSLSVGSVQVNTTNLRRIALESNKDKNKYIEILSRRTHLSIKVLDVIRNIIKRNVEKGLLPNYTYELIKMDNQYNTLGITAMYEVVRDMGLINEDQFRTKSYTKEGLDFATKVLRVINEIKDSYNFDYSINIEAVPAERANSVLCAKDNLLYPNQEKDFIYSNQWIPLMENSTIQEKIRLGAVLDKECGGGQILHVNLQGKFANEEQSWNMLNHLANSGIIYFAYNVQISVCGEGHGFFGQTCPTCGKSVQDIFSRIVGYLVPTQSYSKERKQEFEKRRWFILD